MSAVDAEAPTRLRVRIEINGQPVDAEIESRLLLADFIRERAGLRGTHLGCEHGVCGACTVQLDGEPVRSCLMLAVQADGRSVRTVESLARGGLHPLQQAFKECYGLQCGFCTPGMILSAAAFIADDPEPSESGVRAALAGNLCRCTGYQSIVRAVLDAAKHMRDAGRAGERPGRRALIRARA